MIYAELFLGTFGNQLIGLFCAFPGTTLMIEQDWIPNPEPIPCHCLNPDTAQSQGSLSSLRKFGEIIFQWESMKPSQSLAWSRVNELHIPSQFPARLGLPHAIPASHCALPDSWGLPASWFWLIHAPAHSGCLQLSAHPSAPADFIPPVPGTRARAWELRIPPSPGCTSWNC